MYVTLYLYRVHVHAHVLDILSIVRYYCELSSNNSVNALCPAGSYCPEGSGAPTPCPEGTYDNTQGLYNVSQCTPCDEGYFCNDTGVLTSAMTSFMCCWLFSFGGFVVEGIYSYL